MTEMSVTEMSIDRLSPGQRKIVNFLREYFRDHTYPPSIRDICHGAGINSTSVVDYNLNALARAGFLRRVPGISRGIELLLDSVDGEESQDPVSASGSSQGRGAGSVSLPIVGRIAAGEPIEAVAGDNERITLTADLAPANAYVLKVKGKSMIEDLIDDGDLVVIRPQATAENGDIVVALLADGPTGEGQATLKRFYRERERVRLQPANSEMQPIYADPSRLSIQGKVVAVIRQL